MAAFQKVLIIAVMLVAVAFWSWSIYLDGFYCRHGATTAVAAEGRVYPRKVCHGSQVFLTKKEKFDLDVLYPSVSIGSVLIAGLLDRRWKHFVFKRDFKGTDRLYWFRRKK